METILALRIYMTIVGALGILGNALVCIVIGKVPSSMRTRTNAFIFHQALVDFLCSTMIILQSEVPLPDPLPDDALGWFLCHAFKSNFVSFFLFEVSTFNLLALTMERYFAIVHPFKYRAVVSQHPRLKVGLAIASCWTLGATCTLYGLFIVEFRDTDCVLRNIPGSSAAGIVTVVVQYIVPVGLMLFAYIRMSVELKRGADRVGMAPTGAQQNPIDGTSSADTTPAGMGEFLLRARRNIFKMLLAVFITFVVCWTPNQVLFLIFNLSNWPIHDQWYYSISLAMVATNFCVNPVIYVFIYRPFRSALQKICCSLQGRPMSSGE